MTAALNPDQLKEHLALRSQLGRLIGENRRLSPLPEGVYSANGSIFGSNHPHGAIPEHDLESRNARLRMKIASTTESNGSGSP